MTEQISSDSDNSVQTIRPNLGNTPRARQSRRAPEEGARPAGPLLVRRGAAALRGDRDAVAVSDDPAARDLGLVGDHRLELLVTRPVLGVTEHAPRRSPESLSDDGAAITPPRACSPCRSARSGTWPSYSAQYLGQPMEDTSAPTPTQKPANATNRTVRTPSSRKLRVPSRFHSIGQEDAPLWLTCRPQTGESEPRVLARHRGQRTTECSASRRARRPTQNQATACRGLYGSPASHRLFLFLRTMRSGTWDIWIHATMPSDYVGAIARDTGSRVWLTGG